MNFFIGILKRFPVGVVESGTPIVFTIMAKKYIFFKPLGIFWNAWISHRRRRKINCIQQFFRINVTKSCLNVKPRNMNEVRMTSVVLGGGEEDQVWPTSRCIFRPFLDASSHLYMRSCPSVRPSVRPSVCLSVGWSLCNPFFLNAKNELFSLWKSSGQSNIDIAECAWCDGCA